jgi:NTE family protein
MDTGANGGRLGIVLSGGGARAAYQVGVLSAIGERVPELAFSIVTGVSAGAINALYLAAHAGSFRNAVEQLRGEWLRLSPPQVYDVRPMSLGRSAVRAAFNTALRRERMPASLRGLMHMGPLRTFLSECIDLEGIRRNIDSGRLRAVGLSATSYATGDTVTFVDGVDDVEMWRRYRRLAVRATLSIDHLMASAAIPIVFPAIRVGNAYYGDGSLRQSAPLAPVIHLGATKILAIAMRSRPTTTFAGAERRTPAYPSPAEVLGTLLHSVFLDALDADAERLLRVNDLLESLPPETRLVEPLRPIQLSMVRPSRDVGAMASGLEPRLSLLPRLALRSLGGDQVRSSGLLSYLLFEPEYTGLLMELGYEDVGKQWGDIARFLEA